MRVVPQGPDQLPEAVPPGPAVTVGLMPHRNVIDNAALPLEVGGVAKPERRQRAPTALELVGMADWGGSMPKQLRGDETVRRPGPRPGDGDARPLGGLAVLRARSGDTSRLAG